MPTVRANNLRSRRVHPAFTTPTPNTPTDPNTWPKHPKPGHTVKTRSTHDKQGNPIQEPNTHRQDSVNPNLSYENTVNPFNPKQKLP